MTDTRSNKVVINRDWCKGCNICVTFCPKKVLELDEKDKSTVLRPELCIGCKLCELLCPDLAITVLAENSENNDRKDEEQS